MPVDGCQRMVITLCSVKVPAPMMAILKFSAIATSSVKQQMEFAWIRQLGVSGKSREIYVAAKAPLCSF